MGTVKFTITVLLRCSYGPGPALFMPQPRCNSGVSCIGSVSIFTFPLSLEEKLTTLCRPHAGVRIATIYTKGRLSE